MDAERKAEILERIGHWLDAWPDEDLPAGLDPAAVDEIDDAPDLAGLTAAVAGSGQELKRQGKLFLRLSEKLEDMPETLQALAQGIETVAARGSEGERERIESARAAVRDELLGDLVDLFERLQRCAAGGGAALAGLSWLARRSGAEAVLHAVVDGVELVKESAREALARHDVRRLETEGVLFDPATMRAVATATAESGQAEGTVVETLRPGFLHGGRVLRHAEVKVIR